MTENLEPSVENHPTSQETGTSLAWLADAPLFIDQPQVAAFYDAVVKPEGRRGKTIISLERYEGQTTKLAGSLEAEVSVSKLITTLLPFLDVKGKAQAGAEHERSNAETKGETIEFYAIETPQRQLVQLTLHYLANLPERIRIVNEPWRSTWCDEKFIRALPRALVFVDFPPETKFLPMAGEVGEGKIVTFFSELKSDDGEGPPKAPNRRHFSDDLSYEEAWTQQWLWYKKNFNAATAMRAVETVVTKANGRVRWIDYRVLPFDERPLHLHVSARGMFDTGTFAYHLVKRGFKHGLRVVGTLKSEPDLNVLAIFEK